MQVLFKLPEDIGDLLKVDQDLARLSLESIALEAYHAEKLSASQVRRLLGFESRFELDEFLNRHGIELEYGHAELEQDRETHRL